MGCILLVAGTQIGAGMLALPVVTGVAGFGPSMVLFLISFLYMLGSLFLLTEVNLWSQKVTANIITLSKEHLGAFGQITAWISFLALLYSVAAAYLSGGGALLSELINSGGDYAIEPAVGTAIFLVVFGLVVAFGTRYIDAANRIFIAVLILSFVLLLFYTGPNVSVSGFGYSDMKYIYAATPVVVLSFTSHIIVPSLRTYLAGDHSHLVKALFWGSIIPLVFYVIWECIILGILPGSGQFSLPAIAQADHPVSALTAALSTILHVPTIGILVGVFSFCALVTSFFGVSLALFDFLADGLKVKKTLFGKVVLLCASYIPPLMFVLFYPKGFVLAVGYAGVFVAILYGILPSVMVWKGRYIEGRVGDFQAWGGKVVPALIFLGAFFIIYFQVAAVRGWLPSL